MHRISERSNRCPSCMRSHCRLCLGDDWKWTTFGRLTSTTVSTAVELSRLTLVVWRSWPGSLEAATIEVRATSRTGIEKCMFSCRWRFESVDWSVFQGKMVWLILSGAWSSLVKRTNIWQAKCRSYVVCSYQWVVSWWWRTLYRHALATIHPWTFSLNLGKKRPTEWWLQNQYSYQLVSLDVSYCSSLWTNRWSVRTHLSMTMVICGNLSKLRAARSIVLPSSPCAKEFDFHYSLAILERCTRSRNAHSHRNII